MDVREEKSGATGMQQWHKEQRPKSRLRLGSRKTLNKTCRQTIELEIVRPTVGTSYDCGK
jgi:hypothetical protein